MPDNPLPDAKTQQSAESAEFNFTDAATEAPRIRRRSLKSKQPGLIKASEPVPTVAPEREKEAPPLSDAEAKRNAVAKPAATTAAPPKTTPYVSPAAAKAAPAATPRSSTAGAVSSTPAASSPPRSVPAPGTLSPHPTRPATLYYSSQPRKEKEGTPSSATPSPATAPMKTIPTASTTSPASTQPNATTRPPTSTAGTTPASATRPATASTATTIPTSVTRPAASTTSRPAGTSDYRSNIERQKSEQKSVGSILSYIVYGMIAFFVLAAALAGYGGYVLSQRISDQSVTVNQLDSRYEAADKDLKAKLAAAQDSLNQAQAQITRQNDLIIKQQDKMNQLISALNDNTKAIASEKQTRAQETAALRSRVRELENEKPASNTTTITGTAR